MRSTYSFRYKNRNGIFQDCMHVNSYFSELLPFKLILHVKKYFNAYNFVFFLNSVIKKPSNTLKKLSKLSAVISIYLVKIFLFWNYTNKKRIHFQFLSNFYEATIGVCGISVERFLKGEHEENRRFEERLEVPGLTTLESRRI